MLIFTEHEKKSDAALLVKESLWILQSSHVDIMSATLPKTKSSLHHALDHKWAKTRFIQCNQYQTTHQLHKDFNKDKAIVPFSFFSANEFLRNTQRQNHQISRKSPWHRTKPWLNLRVHYEPDHEDINFCISVCEHELVSTLICPHCTGIPIMISHY